MNAPPFTDVEQPQASAEDILRKAATASNRGNLDGNNYVKVGQLVC